MSHHEEIICPNCGFHATNNYCAQCGQETHLHKDTFAALFMHFIGHYFHYDSKFLQTLKALWFSPGKLTLAYWNKQRMRYIPPISLYIFVSAVFFACAFLILPDSRSESKSLEEQVAAYKKDSTTYNYVKDISPEIARKVHKETDPVKIVEVNKRKEDAVEKFIHNLPKLFFLLIPVMALVLKGLYRKRKELTVVHHTIFALHTQSFFFTIFFFLVFLGLMDGWFIDVLSNVISLIPIAYLIVAMRKTYSSGWIRSILNSAVVVISCVIASAIFLTTFYLVVSRLKL